MNQNAIPAESMHAGEDIRAFNRSLNAIASPHLLNERVLEARLYELEALSVHHNPAYWLTYARLAELTLFCAGTYACHGEIIASGDLLVNPRRILIHPDGALPVIKHRHTPLTQQFSRAAEGRSQVVEWLARHTLVQIRRKALLPHMQSALKASGTVSEAYLHSLRDRMLRIADTLAASCLGYSSEPFGAISHPQALDSLTRDSSAAPCSEFDLEVFHALGETLRWLLDRGPGPSRAKSNAVRMAGRSELTPSSREPILQPV